MEIMRRMLDYCLRERIVPGTDSGVFNIAFGHLDYDLQILHRVGFTPSECLASATASRPRPSDFRTRSEPSNRENGPTWWPSMVTRIRT